MIFQSIGPLGRCFLQVEMSICVFVCLFFTGILGPPYCGIGATIRIGREMLCLPYAGFFLMNLELLPYLSHIPKLTIPKSLPTPIFPSVNNCPSFFSFKCCPLSATYPIIFPWCSHRGYTARPGGYGDNNGDVHKDKTKTMDVLNFKTIKKGLGTKRLQNVCYVRTFLFTSRYHNRLIT